jgi:hypothetical protein
VPLTDADQATFVSFNDWIDGYNDYIIKAFNEAAAKKEDGYEDTVNEFVDVEVQEAA